MNRLCASVWIVSLLNWLLPLTTQGQRNNMVLVEAESFANPGGWAIDAQFMDQMGSPYMLAHGLGIPVTDAKTTITFPQSGTYQVFVRTKDWVSPQGPGRFQVLINGQPLAETFGTKGGGQWYWQDAGLTTIDAKKTELALHDLSGFDGRCDAILFVKKPGLASSRKAIHHPTT